MPFFLAVLIALAVAFAWHRARLAKNKAEAESALFRDCFHNSNEAIFLHDADTGRIVDVNRRFTELYGHSADEARELLIDQLSLGSAPYSRNEARQWLDKVHAEGPQLFDWQARRKNGETFWVEVSLRKSVLSEQVYIVAAIRDISVRKESEARALAIEDRLGQVFSNLPVPVFAIDADHVVTHWNRTCEIVTGYPAAKMIGTREPWRAFYDTPRPVMADLVLDGFRDNQLDLYYSGKFHPSRVIPHCFEAEDYFPHMGSNGVWLSFTAAPLVNAQGQAIGAIETLVDITHRKQAEKGLRSSEGRFRALIEHAPDAIVVYETESGTLVDANPRAGELFGAAHQTLLGTELLAAVGYATPAGLQLNAIDCWSEAIRAAIAGEDRRFEWAYTMADRSTGMCDVHLVRLPDGSGRVFLRGSMADITHRTRAKAALLEERNFLNSLLEAIPAPVFYKDREGHYLGCNDAFLTSIGKQRSDIIGKTVFDMAPAEIAQRYDDMDEALFEHPGRQVYEWVIQKPGGERRTVVFNKATFCGPDGHLAGMIGVILDVTDLKEAHAKLEELNRDLETRVDARTGELRAAMDQLVQSEKLAALGHLVAGVAHELNTPIGNILTLSSAFVEHLQSLSDQLFSGKMKRSEATELMTTLISAAETLTNNASRAGDLVSSFKQVAVDQASVRRRTFNLAQTVEETLRTLTPALKKHRGVQVEVNIPHALTLDSYPGPFEQVLSNLVLNTLLHGFEDRERGQIELSAEQVEDRVVIRFSDDGHGIPAAMLRRVFEPFFTTKLGKGGSGLGLYLVHTLVTGQLGGAIQIDSQPGRGTTVFLRLPLSAPLPAEVPADDLTFAKPGETHNFVI